MDEQMFEMISAFGYGATVVNVITGEKMTLPSAPPVFTYNREEKEEE